MTKLNIALMNDSFPPTIDGVANAVVNYARAIDENGLVTPIQRGSSAVTVTTHNGKSATVTIWVVDPYFPESISLSYRKTTHPRKQNRKKQNRLSLSLLNPNPLFPLHLLSLPLPNLNRKLLTL